ncbi:hypothetical protein POPTR_001G392050v4 [Populus trichocarpa]|uniref:Uncharacterized protein n=1 Tax=Populus trichocarpa TaxID=3694 RepID=A0ACC0TNY3_POPTR|nr:hypothetical protein POPTR_001G392050v4 [Populus trichocarpa]
MSLQPHKEERFLYPINPFVCVAASAVIGSFPDLFQDKYNPQDSSWLVLVLLFVSEVNGIGFLHDFLFLNTSVQFGGLMMDSEVFFHYLSILP